jgi:hypothetical protein
MKKNNSKFNVIILSLILLFCLEKTYSQVRWELLRSTVVDSKSYKAINALACDNTNNTVFAAIDKEVLMWKGTGTYWKNVSSGNPLNANNSILTIHVDKYKNVYASGRFTNVSGNYYVAKAPWNTVTQKNDSWIELGSFNPTGPIATITSDNSGNLYAAGSFTSSTGYRYVAKWNGTSWSELGTGNNALNANSAISTICIDSMGNIYAGGAFTNTNGKVYVSKWNGSNWSEFGNSNIDQSNFAGAFPTIDVLAADKNGTIFAGGNIRNNSNNFVLRKCNGGGWLEVGQGAYGNVQLGRIKSITFDQQNNLFVADCFSSTPNGSIFDVAKWNNSTWSKVGNLNGNEQISSIVYKQFGNSIFAGGGFKDVNGFTYVSNHNQILNTWSEVAPIGNTNIISGVDFCTNYKADTFYSSDCNFLNYWDSISWKRTVSASISNSLFCGAGGGLAIDKFGVIYRSFYLFQNQAFIAKLVNNVWSEVGNSRTALNATSFNDIISDSLGNLYVTGNFVNASNKYYVAKWNGSSWSELGTGNNALKADNSLTYLHLDKFGNVYVYAYKNFVYKISKWNGTSWSYLEPTTPELLTPAGSISSDTFGSIYSTFSFFGSHFLRKWNGAKWDSITKIDNGFIIDKKNNIFQSPDAFNRVKRWGGDKWYEVVMDTSEKFKDMASLFSDFNGNLYASGKYKDTFAIGKISANFFNVPFITRVNNKCIQDNNAYGKLYNPISNVSAISIFLDGVPIPYNNIDSSFQYFTNGQTTLGMHKILAKYTIGSSVLSDSVFFNVAPIVNPSVLINSSGFCLGSSVTFTASPTNGGPSPSYQWQVNGFNLGSNSNTFVSNTLTNNSNVKVIMKSNANCPSPSIVESNVINVVFYSTLLPTLLASGNTIVQSGASSTILTTNTNGGSTPTYQWQDSTNASGWKNIAGATNSSINYSPTLTDVKLRCRMTSNLSCANPKIVFSNNLTFTIAIVTAISTVSSSNYAIKHYPNPVENMLTLDSLKLLDKWQILEIKAINGKQLLQKNISNKTSVQLNLSFLSSGMYVAILRRKDGSNTYLKFIKN